MLGGSANFKLAARNEQKNINAMITDNKTQIKQLRETSTLAVRNKDIQ
jgi:hypothetical protein